jgi:hypothetical protein
VSKSSSSKRITRLLFVFVVSVALACADLVVLAQNDNTQDDTTRGGQMTSNTQNGNMSGNTGGTGTGSRRRRGRRRSSSSGGGNANMSTGNTNMGGEMSGNTNMSADTGGNMNAGATVTTGGRRRRRRSGGNANMSAGAAVTTGGAMAGNMGGEQTDLSGSFTGTVDYPEGGLSGPATLTITGNNFTITPEGGGSPVSGRVTAVTTRGYIAVTMMFGDTTPPAAGQAPPPLPAVSLRARRVGSRVTLMSVPGEKRKFSFSAAAPPGMSGGRRRRRRGRGNRMSNVGNQNAPAGDSNTNMGGGNANTPPE